MKTPSSTKKRKDNNISSTIIDITIKYMMNDAMIESKNYNSTDFLLPLLADYIINLSN